VTGLPGWFYLPWLKVFFLLLTVDSRFSADRRNAFPNLLRK
jgi:hypothetical protein